ncbi:hypothetical protein [Streptomyces sp. SAS_272]|uniref:hypothetical protein n=1 Tax=Streptomyces sp. SAS_272 TaxID=3412747 RepID=UPI00403C5D80
MTAQPLSTYIETSSVPLLCDDAVELARETLAEAASADIHDHSAMVNAAVSLGLRLSRLIEAVQVVQDAPRAQSEPIRDVETAVRELGALPVPAGSEPTFFRPGRTYTQNLPFRAPEDRPSFQCVGVGRHPSKDGALRALGFEQPGAGRPWASAAQRTQEWDEGWVDLGPTKPDRLTQAFAPTQALREDEPAEVFVPQTERSYWVNIATALNAAHSVGMPVGIDLDGTLTDHSAWSVVWDRSVERWTVAGYDTEVDQ